MNTEGAMIIFVNNYNRVTKKIYKSVEDMFTDLEKATSECDFNLINILSNTVYGSVNEFMLHKIVYTYDKIDCSMMMIKTPKIDTDCFVEKLQEIFEDQKYCV